MKPPEMLISRRAAAILLVSLAIACIPKAEDIGALPESSSAEDGSLGSDDSPVAGETEASGTSVGSGTDHGDDGRMQCASSTDPECCVDADFDGVPWSEDNAPNHTNPDQSDVDQDGLGDIADLCPTVVGPLSNAADSDQDGVGNACDLCPSRAHYYNHDNDGSDHTGVGASMLVRNNPTQTDADGDGIGDACDNCPTVANCADEASCQLDANANGVGDACEGEMGGVGAGPIGMAEEDDFDQDGLPNVQDGCPRLPLAHTVDCSDDASVCPENSACTAGVCNHIDSDGDAVGDVCDTCVWSVNPGQRSDGLGQEDDQDGDFVGRACETAVDCESRSDPAPIEFHPVTFEGVCCVQLLVADDDGALHLARTCPAGDADPSACTPLRDPDGVPIHAPDRCTANQERLGACRALPSAVAATPGVLAPAAGCDAGLAGAGLSALANLFASDLTAADPYASACRMPQLDLDFDGLGDACDLCPLAHDPTNAPFIDARGKLWPEHGAFCHGLYSCR